MSNIAPGRALAQVDTAYAQRRMRAEHRVVRTPEMLAVARHYEKMSKDDEKRVARLDPRQHLHGCRCIVCDTAEKACPVEGCGATLRGSVRLAGHLSKHARAARSAQAIVNRRERLAGQRFLDALLGDPARAAQLDLRALRAFEDRIREASGGNRQRRTAATQHALADALGADPKDLFSFSARLAPHQAVIVYRLALLAAVSPTTVTAALIAWGIEKFAADMRAGGIAREEHVPKSLSGQAQDVARAADRVRSARLIPGADDEPAD